MLQRQNTDKRHSMMAVTLDELVPQDHLVRKIDAAMIFRLSMIDERFVFGR
ncbi:hypothetical protein GRQ40_15695 [Anoxybacillus sp. PDR2]|nr:hypothetical protein GRQ40_15695 [Anoxybacillus sp. PDR2]